MSAEANTPDSPTPPAPLWFIRAEALYRWAGWLSGLALLALAWTAPNAWLGTAFGLLGVCQLGHWVIERVEAGQGRKLMRARYVEAAISFLVVPLLGTVGLVLWASDGFPRW